MKTSIYTTALALIASVVLVAAPQAQAAPRLQAQPLLVAPHQNARLPKFGFSSYTLRGVGEVVTRVRRHSLARELGFERGDVIIRMNEFRLNYRGAWRDALRDAMYHHNGLVRLTIRDARTGRLARRTTYVGSQYHGPITPKAHVVGQPGPRVQHLTNGPGIQHPNAGFGQRGNGPFGPNGHNGPNGLGNHHGPNIGPPLGNPGNGPFGPNSHNGPNGLGNPPGPNVGPPLSGPPLHGPPHRQVSNVPPWAQLVGAILQMAKD